MADIGSLPCLGHEWRQRNGGIGCYERPTILLPCGHAVCDDCYDFLVFIEVLRSREDSCSDCRAERQRLAEWSENAKAWKR